MAAILLIVGNAASPTTGDARLKTLLEAVGHTVTYSDDNAGEVTAGVDGVVMSETISSGVMGSAYNTVALPVISFENGNWDNLRIVTTPASELTQTQLTITDTAHPIADGPYGTYTGTVTVATAGGTFNYSTSPAAGVTAVARGSIAGRNTILACESGATLTSGTAPEKRAGMFPFDNMVVNLTTDGENLIKNAFAWAFGVPGGGSNPQGTMAITGGGNITATGRKTARGGSIITLAAGTVTATGHKTARGTMAITGGGDLTATGQAVGSNPQGTLTITGAGAFTATGRKTARGSISITGGGSFTATGPVTERLRAGTQENTLHALEPANTLNEPAHANTLTLTEHTHTLTAPEPANTLAEPVHENTLTAPAHSNTLTAPEPANTLTEVALQEA